MRYLIVLSILFHLPIFGNSQQPTYYNLASGKYVVYQLSTDTKPVSPPDNCFVFEINTSDIYISSGGSWALCPINAVTQTALNTKQATLVNTTNIKSVNGNSLLGSGDIAISGTAAYGSITGTLSNQTDLQTALDAKLATNGNGGSLTGLTKTQVGLANADNTSDANKPVSSATQTALDGKQASGNYLLNTSTSDIGTSPTSSSTVTITHNLGRVPTIIRIYGYGTFTSNAAATATTSSMGVWNSSGNRCVYQRFGAAITTTQAGLSSNTFAILLATGGGSFISGVIQNVTSTQFDIIWSETGTSSAQAYLWEAQEP